MDEGGCTSALISVKLCSLLYKHRPYSLSYYYLLFEDESAEVQE